MSGQRVRNSSRPSRGGNMCHQSRSRPVTRTSATSIGSGSTASPVIPVPTARRTADRPPSAATRYRARSGGPAAKWAVTPSSSWVTSATSRP